MPHDRVAFQTEAERQLATLLDFYGVAWDYEPTEFVLERDRAGNPTEAFRPDFYLPDYDLYVEVTTMRQSLVTKKNRKARKVMARYPGVRVKVLYQRDYLALMLRYGLASPENLDLPDDFDPATEAMGSLLGEGPVQRPRGHEPGTPGA